MGLSNQIPSSRLIQTGVCTSSTRPASPYEGQMIYETDTDLTYVYNGSSWQQISGGTAVGNSGLVFVKSQTITSGTSSTDLDDCFSSTYTDYRIIYSFNGNMNGYVEMRLRSGGTLDTSPWYSNCTRTQANSTTPTVSNFNGNTGFIITDGLTQTTRGCIDLFNPQTASNAFASHASSGLGATAYQYTGGTFHSSASQFTGVRFFSSTAGFAFTGTFTVYGYRKA